MKQQRWLGRESFGTPMDARMKRQQGPVSIRVTFVQQRVLPCTDIEVSIF